jgi:hypothetical protein
MKVAALLAAALAACVLAASAHADGDPASDYLLVQKVFLPFDVHFPKADAAKLAGIVAAANRSGYPIRVAVIGSSYDMGSVTALWRKPQTYARFLGEELRYLYKQRLLVVMPNGIGFNWPGHPVTHEYAVLAGVHVAPGPAGLARAATEAVQRLVDDANVKLVGPRTAPSPSRRNRHDRLVIVLVTLGILALAVIGRWFVRRLAP